MSCNYHTPVAYTAAVFSQLQTCNHCGAQASGLVNPPTATTMQDTMQQDELANLFSRNLSLQHQAHEPQVEQQESKPVSSQAVPLEPQPITYISQHYTHSAHVIPKAHSEPSSIHVDSSELVAILLRNSIDPTALSPSQINLFQNADDGQKLRLLELWRISPPSYNKSQELGVPADTTLQQEEHLARQRYEDTELVKQRKANEQSMWSENEQMMEEDSGIGISLAGLAAQNLAGSTSADQGCRSAEPYMESGYEYLAKRDYDEESRSLRESNRYNQAVDPVYNKPTGDWLWGKPGVQDMENQYGAYTAMREYEIQQQRGTYVGIHGMDEDMIM
ncbi:hypothetical protein EJ05DRAFT_475446 [Pseudovirgaria hyperparasitica]|uniref:Uncharacterized protein n=1 Tax=Pseudovirgaria hyperparasitica TaxID=470096 RepID=A0A6A6WCD6_9PEZI|nr:uncharacterized protein EJ05DRAFT_475446 [Pseudovirgaria hyperparasitica]KAF2759227.1 hypothetical protein EJ05DRAFT_475446 [Pseudovirgaria hyperparasitica]